MPHKSGPPQGADAARQLETIAATLPGAIFSYRLKPDGTTCLPYASAALEELCGLRPEDLAEDAAAARAAMHPRPGLPSMQPLIGGMPRLLLIPARRQIIYRRLRGRLASRGDTTSLD